MRPSLPASAPTWLKRLLRDDAYRMLLLSSIRSLAVRMLGVITGFFVTWMTARFYGAEALGVVSICIGLISVTSVFAKMGLDVALMRFVSRYFSEGGSGHIKGAYRLALMGIVPASLLLSVVLFLIAPWLADSVFHKPWLTDILRINAWMTLPLVLLQMNSECLRGVKRIVSYTFFQTAAVSSFALIGLLLALFFTLSPEVPAYVQFISIVLSGCVSTWYWINKSGFRRIMPEVRMDFNALYKVAAPMFTTTVMQLLMSWIGTLMLASYASEAEVGVYNALIRISVFTNITILAVNGLSMPRFATAFAGGDFNGLRKLSAQASRLILITSLPIFIFLFSFPETLLSVFGPEFNGHTEELLILLIGQFYIVSSGLPGQLLNMTDRESALRTIAVVSAAFQFIVCLILIPAFGMKGACWGQTSGSVVWSVLCILSVRKQLGFLTIPGIGRN